MEIDSTDAIRLLAANKEEDRQREFISDLFSSLETIQSTEPHQNWWWWLFPRLQSFWEKVQPPACAFFFLKWRLARAC